MAEAFKDKFNSTAIACLSRHIKAHYSDFESRHFERAATHNIASLELKERSNQIVAALLKYMPDDFSKATNILHQSLAEELPDEKLNFDSGESGDSRDSGVSGWMLMPVADYITCRILQHPLQHHQLGMELLKACTKRFSAEFAVRPLLRDMPEQTMAYMYEWLSDPNLHVRRLVSEGTRPMLPWGVRLHAFVDNPQLILPLLKQLRDDDSEYVRRSVANSLNDIAKHHPNLVADIAEKWWQEGNKNRIKLLKHACRTLIKNGHPKVLLLLGYAPAKLSKVSLTLKHDEVPHGTHQEIELRLKNALNTPQKLLIDYVVYHQKANGSLLPKVFKWKSVDLAAKNASPDVSSNDTGELVVTKSHSFKAVTTRKYYSGEHKIEILINGAPFIQQSFTLV